MKKVEVIQADASLLNAGSIKGGKKKLHVAAYCRVSTDMEDQKYSYASQVDYYKNMIASKKGWELAGVYADEGISGTMTAKRQNFVRMIDDCMDGKIDAIVTKSISRFARNTLDVLRHVRQLRDMGIAVFFEEENINTLSMEGEMLLTVLSSVYQQEVENISSHVKKGLQMKMSRGELVGFHGCLGYDVDRESKTLVVNPKEAEIVKYIFQRYVEGVGTSMISHELEKLGWKTKKGSTKWAPAVLRGILKNEKYTGDLLMGKSFTVDPISHRRLPNKGEANRYLVQDHHPAIIPRTVFDKAQEIRESRGKNGYRRTTVGYRKSVPKEYVFSGMIECAFCHSIFTRRISHSHTPYEKIQWGCMKKTLSGKESCPHSKAVDEDAIKKAFVESYSIICRNNEKVVDELMGYVQEFFESHDLATKVANLQKELEKMRRKRDRLINMRMDDLIGEIEYKSKYHEVCDKVAELEKAVYKANKVLGQGKSGIKKRLEGIHKILENPKDMMDFNQDVFEAVIEKIIIGEEKEDGTVDPYRIIFIYKTGFQDELDSRRFKKGRGSAEGTATTTDGILDAQEMSQKQNIEVEDLSQKQEVDTGVFALAQMTGGYENCIETGMCICPTWAYAHPFFMSDCSPSHSHALSDGDNPRG